MFNKLRTKLITAVSLAVIVIISIFAFINIRSQRTELLKEVERHIDQLGESVKSSTKYDMLLNNRSHLAKIIQQIGNEPGIKGMRILNKDGSIIYSSDSTEVGHMVDKKAQACYICHAENQAIERLPISNRTRIFRVHPDSTHLFGIISPIYNEPSCWLADCHAHSEDQTVLGVLDVTIDIENIDAQIESAKIKMVLMALIATLALSGIIWFFVDRWVNKPVNIMVAATKRVASGNLHHTIEDLGEDELGLLAKSFNNMTEKLSEARMQLFQSDKMASLGRLAAGVAHEINNPLTGILTYSSFLLKRADNDPELKDDLNVIVRETKRSREIVKGLLDFARQSVPKKNRVNINVIIERAISVIENQLTISQIKTVKHFDPNLPDLIVDANQIQQVFINLIGNAADAIGDEGGTITISTKHIYLAPYGVAQIKHAICPKGHDLIDTEVKIDGLPSVKVKARSDGDEGLINIDPVYGKNDNHYRIDLTDQQDVELFCPRCDSNLVDRSERCPRCEGAVYVFDVPGKGQFKGCARKGCEWQHWASVEKEGIKDFVEIDVTDNGCGISKDNLEKVFEPFFTTKGQKGTGLGLAVTWGIIDNHNGSISAASEIGKGATFTIRLPAADTDERAAQ
jgi:two-component system NtrC family sensor kinase